MYAAIDTESKLLLEIDVFSRRGTDTAAAFLHRLTEKHDIDETEFLVDAGGYLTALARHELSGQINYSDRNHVEKWFQMECDRIFQLEQIIRDPINDCYPFRERRHTVSSDIILVCLANVNKIELVRPIPTLEYTDNGLPAVTVDRSIVNDFLTLIVSFH